MTLTTEQLRKAWAPAKSPKGGVFLGAYRALDVILRRWGFNGGQGDTGAYNGRKITGGTGWSLHAYGPGDRFTFWYGATVTTALAVDIDWTNNPYGPVLHTNMPRAMVDEIKALRTNSGKQVWGWGGDYSGNKDAMHFEIVCAPADLATGIAGPAPAPAPPPVTHLSKEDEMNPMIIQNQAVKPGLWLLDGGRLHGIGGPDLADVQAFLRIQGFNADVIQVSAGVMRTYAQA